MCFSIDILRLLDPGHLGSKAMMIMGSIEFKIKSQLDVLRHGCPCGHFEGENYAR